MRKYSFRIQAGSRGEEHESVVMFTSDSMTDYPGRAKSLLMSCF